MDDSIVNEFVLSMNFDSTRRETSIHQFGDNSGECK